MRDYLYQDAETGRTMLVAQMPTQLIQECLENAAVLEIVGTETRADVIERMRLELEIRAMEGRL